MRISLRLKVSLIWIAVVALAAWLIGLVLYLTSQQLFTRQFLAGKLALAKAIAASINGDFHARLTSREAAADPEYQRSLRYLAQVKSADPYVTYLYTLNLDEKSGALTYAIDSEILDADTVYVESTSFAIWFYLKADGALEVVANEKPHGESFTAETADGRQLRVEIRAVDGAPAIWVAGQLIGQVVRQRPLAVKTPAGILDAGSRILTKRIDFGTGPSEVTFSFSGAGESASAPGTPFIDTTENLALIRGLIREDRDFIEPAAHRDIYGSSLSAFAVIHGSRGRPVGLVEMDFYERERETFDRVLRLRAMIATVGVSSLVLLVSLLISQYLIGPLQRLAGAVRAVAGGRMETRVSLRRSDELGELAHGFNGMVESLERLMAEQRQTEQRLATLAYVDQVTDLPNRKAFQDRLHESLLQARRVGASELRGLLFLDLDHFKNVNDTLGHDAGDKVLRMAAGRIRDAVRQSDMVFRQGGDEFTVLLTFLAAETHAAVVAEKLVQSLHAPFLLDGNTLHLGVSVGIAVHPRDGADSEELLRAADTALFEAKRDRNAYRFFDSAMQERAFSRLALVEQMHRGIERGEFRLDYQPQVDREGRLTGCEGLLRWQPPGGQVVMPGTFISAAEETGLIIAIGRLAFEASCRLRRALRERGRPDLRVAVNLSVRQLHDPDLLSTIDQLLRENGIDTDGLELEITESGLIDEPATEAILSGLRGRGIRLAIDDFGTGYSSLSRLRTLPVSLLKIDRSFVAELPGSGRDSELVRSIITAAHGFGMAACAEGVETQAQMDHLAAMGCDFAQGFLFGPAMPEAEFLELACRRQT